MQIEYAFLADAAQTAEGKLYVLGGGIDRITTRKFPTTHPFMTLVIKLKLHPSECGRQHKLDIELWDQDGQRVGPQISGELSRERQPDAPTQPVFFQVVLNVIGAKFDRPGMYEFHILVNGEYLKSVPLELRELQESGSAGVEEGSG